MADRSLSKDDKPASLFFGSSEKSAVGFTKNRIIYLREFFSLNFTNKLKLIHEGKVQFKALAKRNASHRKSTQVLLLALTCIPFGHPLAFTCEDLRRLAFDLNMFKFWTQVRPTGVSFGHSTQVDASFRKSFELFWKPFSQSDAAV